MTPRGPRHSPATQLAAFCCLLITGLGIAVYGRWAGAW